MRPLLALCLMALPLGAEPPATVRLEIVSYAKLAAEVKALKGKVVLVDVWGTFCAPCKEKFPHIIALHEKYQSRGLAVVTVSVDLPDDVDAPKAIRAFLEKERATCRNFQLTDKSEVWQTKWKIDGPPLLFLFDREGRLAAKWEGKADLKEVEKRVSDEFR